MDKVQFKVGDRVLVKRAFQGNEAVVGTYGTVVRVGRNGSVAVNHDVESPLCILVMAMQHGVMVGITYPMSIDIWSWSPPSLMFQKLASAIFYNEEAS